MDNSLSLYSIHRKKCYGCGSPHSRYSRFCSTNCAAKWAEQLAEGNGDYWCPDCRDWVYECRHKPDQDLLEYTDIAYVIASNKSGEILAYAIGPSDNWVAVRDKAISTLAKHLHKGDVGIIVYWEHPDFLK